MEDTAHLGPPIDVRDRFAPERAALLELLGGLAPQQWRATAVPGWSVGDTAAHILGDDYTRLAGLRDGHTAAPRPHPGEAFETFIHRANREWVQAARRISPPMLMESLELTGRRVAAMWGSCDLHAPGLPVSWAGVAGAAPLWLDGARDLTEYWTHRQQIRAAVGLATEDGAAEEGAGGAAAPPVLAVVLDTFMRALPHTLRATPAAAGTRVRIAVPGAAGGTWTAEATAGGAWTMAAPAGGSADAQVELDAATAWRLCVRAIGPAQARARARIRGDGRLAEAACRIVSIIY
ncbi:maleylpyruvate isomerase family mycothiol-dependent enzyme [Streptomonospora sediminis]